MLKNNFTWGQNSSVIQHSVFLSGNRKVNQTIVTVGEINQLMPLWNLLVQVLNERVCCNIMCWFVVVKHCRNSVAGRPTFRKIFRMFYEIRNFM